ncbi:MAG: YfhO family protein [Eubacteriaceae bacterium]
MSGIKEKIKNNIRIFLEKEFVRFLIVGGINTIIGYLVTLFLFYIIKFDYLTSQLLNFVICFPIAYSLQAIYAFRTKWSFKRLLIYPLSSLPNWVIQFATLILCVEVFSIEEYLSYLISYIVPIPIMFFVVKFLVKPFKREQKDKVVNKYTKQLWVYSIVYTVLFSVIYLAGFWDFIFVQGKSFVWKDDGVFQYIPYLYDMAQTLKGIILHPGDGIPLWSWQLGLGADTIFSYIYYLIGDPLSMLAALLVPLKHIEKAYNIIVIIRFFLVGFSFLLYSKYMRIKLLPAVTGSLIYTFSSFMVFWGIRHPYFINAAVFLPLLFLSIELIFKKKSPYLFIILIAFNAINNFYFFYMNTLAIFIYSFVRYFYYNKENRVKSFFNIFTKTVGYYILGITLASGLFISSVYAFLNTSRGVDYQIQYNLFSLDYYIIYFKRFFFFGFEEGFPPITIAAISLPCIILSWFSKKKQNKSFRLLWLIMIILLCLPFIYSVFNGFSAPNPRWLYIYSMIASFLTVLTLNEIESYSKKEILYLVVILLVYSTLFIFGIELFEIEGIIISMISILLFIYFLYFNKKNTRSNIKKENTISQYIVENWFYIFIVFLVSLNLITNTNLIMQDKIYGKDFKEYNTIVKSFKKDITSYTEEIEDESFYRVDYNDVRNNKGVINDFKSPHFFNSLLDGDIVEFYNTHNISSVLYKTGYIGVDNISVLECILGVKYYLLNENEKNTLPYGFKEYKTYEDEAIYYNTNTLPLGFVYYNFFSEETMLSLNEIDRTQALLEGAYIKDSSISNIAEITDFAELSQEINYEIKELKDVEINNNKISVLKKNGEIILNIDRVENAELYVEINNIHRNNELEYFKIKVKHGNVQKSEFTQGVEHQYYVNNHDFLMNLGYKEIHNNQISIIFPQKDEYTVDSIKIYMVNMENFDEKIDNLKEASFKDIKYSNNYITGEVSLEKDGILFLSIPYSSGWNAYVDGERVDTIKINTAFTGIVLNKGQHEVYLKYRTPLLIPALITSLIGSMVLFAMIIKGRNKLHKL